MKDVIVKDEMAVAEFTLKYLEKIKENPEKYMPRCTLCGIERSNILLAYSPEGEKRTALFGVCLKCAPAGVDGEIIEKVMMKVKENLENGDHTIHITPQEWKM